MTALHNLLSELPELVNLIFNILDLFVVRFTLLALAVLGVYALLSGHHFSW